MSLARVYNAFIKAGVDETTATEAVDRRLTRVEAYFIIIIALLLPIFIKIFWG